MVAETICNTPYPACANIVVLVLVDSEDWILQGSHAAVAVIGETCQFLYSIAIEVACHIVLPLAVLRIER